jgi:uncharacterized protein YtpQ (UPF0354 family)
LGVTHGAIAVQSMSMRANDWRTTLRHWSRDGAPSESLAPAVGEALLEQEVGSVEVVSGGEIAMRTPSGAELRIRLDNLRASLAQAEGPEARVGLVEYFARAVKEALRTTSEAESLRSDDLVPLVRDARYVAGLGEREGPDAVIVLPFVADLHLVLAFDGQHTQHLATWRALERLGIDESDVLRVARENLARKIEEVEQRTFDEGEGAFVGILACGGDLEASLLLVDEVWRNVAANVSGDVIACVPARDVVLFADAAAEGAVARMGELADEILDEGDHTISPTLLRRTSSGWERYADA